MKRLRMSLKCSEQPHEEQDVKQSHEEPSPEQPVTLTSHLTCMMFQCKVKRNLEMRMLWNSSLEMRIWSFNTLIMNNLIGKTKLKMRQMVSKVQGLTLGPEL